MAKRKKVESLDDAPVDVFEAVKRAFIKRGVVRGRRPAKASKKRKSQTPASKTATPNPISPEGIEPADAPEKLVDLAVNAHEVLYEAHTVFPLTLFPDTITIDREKLTVANRTFFKTATIISSPIADIQSVQVNLGPFFASLHTTSKFFVTTPRIIRYLWRKDAIAIQRLLQGYIIANQKQIDCTTIDKEQLITLLNDLGQGVSD